MSDQVQHYGGMGAPNETPVTNNGETMQAMLEGMPELAERQSDEVSHGEGPRSGFNN